MSAVMSTLSIISGGRRAHRKLASSRKSGQLSDAGAAPAAADRRDLTRQQRSASLQTLETNGGVVNLEHLEAKMASIEVSLGGRRRRAGAGRDLVQDLDALKDALADKDSLIQSLKKQLSATLSAARLAAQSAASAGGGRRSAGGGEPELTGEERKALEERAAAVRAEVETRRTTLADLRRQLETTHVTDNIDTRIEHAELQYRFGREELELLSLQEQARALAALLQHADARAAANNATLYSAVRGCGGESAQLVCVESREGAWGAAQGSGPGLYVEWARPAPADSALAPAPGDKILEVNGVSLVSSRSTEELERVLRSAAAPARLVLLRPAALPRTPPNPAPAPALTQAEVTALRTELGSLRSAAEDAQRTKDGLKADNTRLTHRISYLEDQVAELLARHAQPHSDTRFTTPTRECQKNVTNISIGADTASDPRPCSRSEVQVFQKGPDITAIVAKLPGLDRAENGLPVIGPRSGASSRASPAPPPSATSHRRSHGSDHRARHSLSTHSTTDYRADTDAALRIIERNRRHIERERADLHSGSDAEADPATELSERCRRDAADRIHDTIKKTNWAERKTMSIIEQLKRSQRSRKAKSKNDSLERLEEQAERRYVCHKIDGKVLENAHKSSRRSSKLYSRSAKSSEFESECSDRPNGEEYRRSRKSDYGSEPALVKLARHEAPDERVSESEARTRPTPPRKPVRLSLHKARSAHSLATGSEPESNAGSRYDDETGGKKPVKRSYAGDRWERCRDGARGTPRPLRRLDPLSACEAPRADRLYPLSACEAPRADRLYPLSACVAPRADRLYPHDVHAPPAHRS